MLAGALRCGNEPNPSKSMKDASTSPASSFPQAVQAAVELLETTGRYRLLQHVPTPIYNPNGHLPGHIRLAVVDCEATDGDPQTAHPIELGIVKVAVDLESGTLLGFIDSLSQLEAPSVPIQPAAQATHQIAHEELAGKRFDDQAVESFLSDVDLVVAHNAGFDRPVLARRLPVFDRMAWACTMRDVDWHSRGCSSRALEYLLFKAGMFHNGHRAMADCEATAALLGHTQGLGHADNPSHTVLQELLKNAYTSPFHILAVGSDFDAKDRLKQRDYQWNAGDGRDGRFPVKCWSSPSLADEHALQDELRWLASNAYQPGALQRSEVIVVSTSALTRYSEQAARLAMASAIRINLRAFLNNPAEFFEQPAVESAAERPAIGAV